MMCAFTPKIIQCNTQTPKRPKTNPRLLSKDFTFTATRASLTSLKVTKPQWPFTPPTPAAASCRASLISTGWSRFNVLTSSAPLRGVLCAACQAHMATLFSVSRIVRLSLWFELFGRHKELHPWGNSRGTRSLLSWASLKAVKNDSKWLA